MTLRPHTMFYSPLGWITVTVATYAAVTNASWLAAAAPERLAGLGRRLEQAQTDERWARLVTVGRGLYFFGVPALALANRVGRPSHWGLARPPSAESIGLALAITVVTGLALVGGRAWFDMTTRRWRRPGLRLPDRELAGQLAVSALLREAHWAFFRAGTLSVGLDNTTLAVFLSLGLIALEAWSNPWRRVAFDNLAASRELADSAGLAVMSGLVFLATASTPACLVAHLAVAGTLAALAPATREVAEHLPGPATDRSTARHAGRAVDRSS